MPLTATKAIDELYGIVKSAVDGWPGLYGYAPEVRWQGVAVDGRPNPSKTWARVSHKIVHSPQTTLADLNGKKRYTTTGLLYIQLFASRAENNSKQLGRYAADFMKDAFRSPASSGEFIFRDAKVVELDATSESYPFNVVVNFEYDEISPAINVVTDLGLPADSKPHLPVEAPDGVRTSFTFLNLPGNEDEYAIVINGLIQADSVQTGNQLDFGYAPVIGDQILVYF